jgi:competence protein ComEC
MTVKSKKTRFRAYQLGNAGSSFSYFNGGFFTLIEARYNETNEESIKQELKLCDVTKINNLHITSWDRDHCSPSQLEKILAEFKPNKIEYPGYSPHSEAGKGA